MLPPSPTGSPTIAQDTLRSGWNPSVSALSPAVVGSGAFGKPAFGGPAFGKQWTTQLDGPIYGQPVVSGNTVIAVTQKNRIYALDAVTGKARWGREAGTPWPPATIGCGDTGVNVGITSTPVVDTGSGTVYFTAKTSDGTDVAHPHYDMHAVDITTGTERAGWPVRITGAPSNDPSTPFDARFELQRPGLLLLDGVVYAAFGGMCGLGPYRGYVVGVSTAGKITAMWTSEPHSSDSGGGIWQSGGGLVSDGPGEILLTTGNGASDTATAARPPGRLAEAVVRLRVAGDGSLSATDYFMPVNTAVLNADDVDLGSGSPLAIPDGYGTRSHPHLLVQIGKDGRLYLLDRDRLGGRGRGPGGGDAALAVIGPYEGVWGAPAFYGRGSGYVYLVGSGGPLRAFALGRDATGTPTLTQVGRSAGTFPYTSGSPAVTSQGRAPGSGVVWEVYTGGASGKGGQLRAYGAVPVGGTLPLLFSADLGTAVKFAKLGTDGERVFVGDRDGQLSALGRGGTPAAIATTGHLGSVPVGVTARGTVVVRASRALTVTGVTVTGVTVTGAGATVTGPFATSGVVPVALGAGGMLSVPVTFTPSSAGPAEGELVVSTDRGPLTAGLEGTGTAPGIVATAPVLDLGRASSGRTVSGSVTFTNTGTAATRVDVAPPQAPFTVRGLPGGGMSLAAGASVTATVSFRPATSGTFTGVLVVGGARVQLTGRADPGTPTLGVAPGTLDLGSVEVGSTRTATFELRNTGTGPLTVTKAKAPTGAFASADPLPEGFTLAPGQVIRQTVTFSPTAAGPATGRYVIATTAGGGNHDVVLRGTGTVSGDAVPAPPTRSWRLAGGAALDGGDLVLTTAAPHRAASAVYPGVVATDGLHATFTVRAGGGSGGDGTTFALLDASRSSPTVHGTDGGELGFGGLQGVAVALDTWPNGSEPKQSVAVLAGSTGRAAVTIARSADVPALRKGSHVVDVAVLGGRVTVGIDGATVLDVAAPVAASAFPAFTAATGDLTDRHVVSNVTITQGVKLPPPTAAGWVRAGSAVIAGPDLVFGGPGAGSTFPTGARTTSTGTHAMFTVHLPTGSGGVTLALLDQARRPGRALGTGLGFAGLPGVAVALDAKRGDVSLLASGAGASIRRSATATHAVVGGRVYVVDVVAAGGRVTVRLDGRIVLDAALVMPAFSAVGFTGSGSADGSAAVVSGVRLVATR